IVPTFDGLVDSLDNQRELFASADAIPTQDLPAQTVPWGLFLAGLALIAVGVLLYKPGWLGLASVGTLGVLIVVVTLVLSLIPKAGDADQLNENLEPIYTAELVAQAGGALGTVSAMGTQMQTEMLPTLAGQLGMSGDELNGFLGANFPATATALSTLPEALGRFDGLVTNFENNLDNYETLKPTNCTNIIWTLFIGGFVPLAAFGMAWWSGRKEDGFVDVEPVVPELIKYAVKV
ncbi:MAG: hypothetical protein GY773_19760, partial [Actinomycetia bacterium]|nr:hypothetical protein [Actinomycetes bacterium]